MRIPMRVIESQENVKIKAQDIVRVGGGGGSDNYNELTNKPQINGTTLQGNKSLDDLGITEAIGTEVETYVEAHKSELKGDKGDDGFSPSARVEQTSGGAIVTVTDASGTTTTTISNGIDGTDGTDGQDGFSPVANVVKSGKTATITVTDANGTTTAQISDGEDGADGQDGTVVAWNQLIQSGTKIATITVDGVQYDVYAPSGGSGGGAWGSITGTLSDQTDLQNALNAKADETDIPSMVDSEFANAFRLSSLDATERQAIIDILVGMGFERAELPPDPIIVQTGSWQYKTTPTKGYIILGKDDDTHDEAMFVRMASGYGFPVTLNTIYGNAYDTSSHRQTDDADSEYSLYPVGSVSRLPEGGTIHDVNKIVIDNNLGEIAQHGYAALWNSETVTDETWNTLFATYQSGGGLKTKQQMIDALKTDYASTDISQGATYLTDGRQALKEDLQTVVQTLGTWGVTGNFKVDGITVCSESALNIPAYQIAREFNFWGAGMVTTYGNDVQDPWEYPRRSGGLSSVQNLTDACQYAYNNLGVVEVFAHQFFTGHGTQAEWTLFKSLMVELKDWVDDGKIEVVTRYQYSQLGEIVEHPITSLQFSPKSLSFDVGTTLTASDFNLNAVLDDSSVVACNADRILDLSQVDTSEEGTYTATLWYRGFKATCSVVVSGEPTPEYLIENGSWSGQTLTYQTSFCTASFSVVQGHTYHLEFDIVLTNTTQYAVHYIELNGGSQFGRYPINWFGSPETAAIHFDSTEGTTSQHISIDVVANHTSTECEVLYLLRSQNTGIQAWSVSNLYLWEVTE